MDSETTKNIWILDDLWKYRPKSRPKTIKGLTWTALCAPVCSVLMVGGQAGEWTPPLK